MIKTLAATTSTQPWHCELLTKLNPVFSLLNSYLRHNRQFSLSLCCCCCCCVARAKTVRQFCAAKFVFLNFLFSKKVFRRWQEWDLSQRWPGVERLAWQNWIGGRVTRGQLRPRVFRTSSTRSSRTSRCPNSLTSISSGWITRKMGIGLLW